MKKSVLAGHMFCYFPQIQDTHHQVAAASASQATVNMSIICFISQEDPDTCCTLSFRDCSQKKKLHNDAPAGFAGESKIVKSTSSSLFLRIVLTFTNAKIKKQTKSIKSKEKKINEKGIEKENKKKGSRYIKR